ncbi:MAG: TSUP family transporter, partial [Dehalococcoidia bacterium]
MTWSSIAYALVCVALGGFVRGYAGFGAAMIWVSSLSLVFPPALVVPCVLLLDIVASVQLIPTTWRLAHWRSLRWLLAGSVLGIPLGQLLLAKTPDDLARIAIGVMLLAATAITARGASFRALPRRRATVALGMASGVFNGGAAIGGPPAVLMYLSTQLSVAAVRASLITYFFCLDALATAAAAATGLLTTQAAVLAAVLL